MRLFPRRSPPPAPYEQELRHAIDDYLETSRSPLRFAEPGWWELAEASAWERLRLVARASPPPSAPPAVDLMRVSPPGLVERLRAGRS
jgi:hypothetical protein